MLPCKTIFSLSLLLCSLRNIYASELRAETIVDGYEGNITNFKYQAAILGKRNYSYTYNMICGGGIISNFHVLTAAHCFVEVGGDLRDLTFLIKVASDDLNDMTNGISRKVRYIYIKHTHTHHRAYDIAIAKLKYGIGIRINPAVAALSLPTLDETFQNQVGKTSGFGYTRIQLSRIPETNNEIVISGNTDLKLKYGYVRILPIEQCLSTYPFIATNSQICGLMVPILPRMHNAGVCIGDGGNPLVIGNKIVGVVSLSSLNCDDVSTGAIYTSMSGFVDFIRTVLEGHPEQNTTIYRNRRYILS